MINTDILIKAPELIARTLTRYSYYGMFSGCVLLDELTTYADDISAENC